MARLAVIGLLALGVAHAAIAQPAPLLVRGRVAAAGSNEPLRRARVALARPDSVPGFEPVLTDGEGRFVLTIATPSTPVLLVTKAGYATTTVRVPTPAKGVAADLQIRLARGAVISGRVLTRSGGPGVGLMVVARRLDPESGAGVPTVFDVQVSDLGEYRLFGLPAGRYSVTAGTPPPRALRIDADPPQVFRTEAQREAALAMVSGPSMTVDVVPGSEREGIDFEVETRQQSDVFTPPGPLGWNGSGVIRGRVRASLSLTTVLVTLKGDRMRMTPTDATGRFEFTGVPTGDYSLEAAGDITAQYGRQCDIRAGDVIRVSGQTAGPPDCGTGSDPALAGVILDDFGEPFQGASVQALELRYVSGRSVAIRMGLAGVTDDRGHYRLFNLPPGSYLVAASIGASASVPDAARTQGFAPVYFPGTSRIDGALPVQLDDGPDALGVDMTLAMMPAGRVSGVALDEGGHPLAGTVRLFESQRFGAIALEPRVATLGAAGAFELAGLSPGEYVAQAFGDATFGTPPRFGAAFVSVAEGDMPPLTITASTGATLEGELRLEGGGQSPISGFSLVPFPADSDLGAGSDLRTSGLVVSSTGAFYQRRLHGPTRFVLARAPEGWYLKSITIGGVDATDTPFDFGTGEATLVGAEIVLSQAGASIQGSVSGERGASGQSASVVVFPEGRDRWFAGSRHVKYSRTSADGAFQFRSLPPGTYWVAAVGEADRAVAAGEWQSPEVLERLSSHATRVTLREGETSPVEVRVRGG